MRILAISVDEELSAQLAKKIRVIVDDAYDIDDSSNFLRFRNYDLILIDYDLVIEPSAGNGAFSRNIKHNNFIALDIEPENDKIIQQDWFEYKPNQEGDILVIGNPPFGKRNMLSKKFIQHAMTFAKTIAFILPDVYNKHTLQSVFFSNLYFCSCLSFFCLCKICLKRCECHAGAIIQFVIHRQISKK